MTVMMVLDVHWQHWHVKIFYVDLGFGDSENHDTVNYEVD